MVRVVKIGGSALTDSGWMADFASHVARSKGQIVVVHGGGPEISELSARLGLDYTWANGRRVTSPELMDVVGLVLNGRVNKRITSALLNAGADTIGLSGEDGALVLADFAEGGALGRVGQVRTVRVELLEWMTSREIVPVVSPVSRGPDGGPVNVNADEVASGIAVSLSASELIFLTDVPGVLEDGVVRRDMTSAEARQMIDVGIATDGMALKLTAATKALATGVAMVRIGRFETLLDPTAGTRVRQEAEVMTCL